MLMEANPTKAVLVEKVKDCEFRFLANAYSNQDQYAWALGCDKTRDRPRMVELGQGPDQARDRRRRRRARR